MKCVEKVTRHSARQWYLVNSSSECVHPYVPYHRPEEAALCFAKSPDSNRPVVHALGLRRRESVYRDIF